MMTDKGTFIINGKTSAWWCPSSSARRRHLPAGRAVPACGNLAQAPASSPAPITLPGEWIVVRRRAEPGKDVTAARVAASARLSIFVLLPRPRLRRGERARLHPSASSTPSTSLEGQWRRAGGRPEPRTRPLVEDLQAGPRPGRAAHDRVGAGLLRNAFLRAPALRPSAGSGRYKAEPASSAPSWRTSRRPSLKTWTCPPTTRPVLTRCEVSGRLHVPSCTRQGDRLPPGRTRDHFSPTRIRSVGELIQNQVRKSAYPA